MGTHATIHILGGTEPLLEECIEFAHDCEQHWSRFLPDSDISRLNWAEGASIDVHPSTADLIRAMIDGHRMTHGGYDPTLLPAVIGIGYAASVRDASKVTRLPASAIAPGDVEGIRIDGTTVCLPRGTTLDAGGIGKGFAADLVCAYALDRGAWGAMAEIGGDLVVDGRGPDDGAWLLGVEIPGDSARYRALVRLQRGALVTSSRLERRFGPDLLHHLIDPATGTSAATDVQTVSVIAATGARAEVLTKPGFLTDTAEYLAWLPTLGAAGMVITASGVALASANWEQYA